MFITTARYLSRQYAVFLFWLVASAFASPVSAVMVTTHADAGGTGYYDIANTGSTDLYAIAIANDSATYADDIGANTWLGTVVSIFEWDAGFGFFGATGWTAPDTTDTFNSYFGTGRSQLTVYWVADDGFGAVGTPILGGQSYTDSLRFLGDLPANAPFVAYGQGGVIAAQGFASAGVVSLPAAFWLFVSGLTGFMASAGCRGKQCL